MTFHAYVATLARHPGEGKRDSNDLRWGQLAFNNLSRVRPDLSEQIVGTRLDPFHNDGVMPEFLAWLGEHWDDPHKEEKS